MVLSLRDAVVVITGASSGIGRATARAFADQGAALVLAARRGEALHEVAEECIDRGGRAMAVETDVGDEAQVRRLAQRAIDAFGRIDVWVNNAGVGQFGKFEDIPAEVFERVLQTNFLGQVYGARAVLPHFRAQKAGVLINVASMVSNFGVPYQSAYVASKFAVRGFSQCLRQELELDPQAQNIHVSVVMPAVIDTPLWQHSANHTGRELQAAGPVYPPEQVADVIVALVRHPKREVFVGSLGRAAALGHVLAPALAERLTARQMEAGVLREELVEASDGNVLRPMPEGRDVSGGWSERQAKVQHAGRSAANGTAVLAGVALAALPLTLYALRRRGGRYKIHDCRLQKAEGLADRERSALREQERL